MAGTWPGDDRANGDLGWAARRRPRTALVLLAVLLLLGACGPAPAATDVRSTPQTVASPRHATASLDGASQATPEVPVATGPVSMTVSASRAPIFHYRGRTYWQVGMGRGGADEGLQADQPVGATFSRWQSNGLVPAGAAIHGVAGQPIERMLAVRHPSGFAFFTADDRPSGLESFQVVQGTVVRDGPARWSTPDGAPPPTGQGPAGPEAVHATLYTPATIAVARALQGRIPPGTAIEVRQIGGTVGGNAVSTSVGSLITLAPGTTVILFLTPGQWDPGMLGGAVPPGDYYQLWPERAYAVADGQVTPLGVPGAADDRVPLPRFEAGLAETFRGVAPLDPHGPKPTPGPPPPTPRPAPTPTPRFAAGQPVDLAREHGLAGTRSIYLKSPAIPPERAAITDPARVAAIVATLDGPLPARAGVPDPPRTQEEQRDQVLVYFRPTDEPTAAGPATILEYRRAAGTLTDRTDPANPYSVPAPPGFARLLGLE